MKIFNLFIMSVIISIVACKSSQSPNSLETKYEIIGVMHEQVTAWNSGDIEGYMKGYWNSDSLQVGQPR